MKFASIDWRSVVTKVIVAVLLVGALVYLGHERNKMGSQADIEKLMRK